MPLTDEPSSLGVAAPAFAALRITGTLGICLQAALAGILGHIGKYGGVSNLSNFVTLGVLHLPHIVLKCILKYCCPNLTLSAIPGMIELSNPPPKLAENLILAMFGGLYLRYFQEGHLGAPKVAQLDQVEPI